MHPQPTGTVTFLFTDIEASTQHWEAHPAEMAPAFARHEALLRQAIAMHGGWAYKQIGDAFQAAFQTAPDALAAAVDAQLGLAGEPWPAAIGPLRVRMALHTGTTEERADDYVGPLLNRLARLLSAGHGGQILLTAPTYELVRDHLPAGVTLRDLGEQSLKDVVRPEHVWQPVVKGLPADFPPLRTVRTRLHNLPAQLTNFVGRIAQLEALRALLRRRDVRLVTCTGPGGTGKTRLAQQVAAEVAGEFADGVFFVSFATLGDPDLVLANIAHAVGVHELAGVPLSTRLHNYLADKALLLLLDNFEQVAAAGPLLASLLATAPQLKVLVTSRARLRVRGEQEFMVPPLACPDLQRLPRLPRLVETEAVRLFIDRARDVQPSFVVTAENAPAVAAICHRLDGLPLAIELAAARTKILAPATLLARLENRLQLLIGGAQDLPARQQTLRGAIAWSYDLLTAQEQQIFRGLGVFVGGASLAAAEQVLATARSGATILDSLMMLVDQSLVGQAAQPDGQPRFDMLETIHEFAQERLGESGEGTGLRTRHAQFFLTLARDAEAQLGGPDQLTWLERLDQEHDNLRAAFDWLDAQGDQESATEMTAGLGLFWELRCYWTEGAAWMKRVLQRAPDAEPVRSAARANTLYSAGRIAGLRGDNATGRALLEESLTIFQELGDTASAAWALRSLGYIANDEGDYAQSERFYSESLAQFRTLGQQAGVARSLNALGETARCQGDYLRAGQLYRAALDIFRTLGYKGQIATALANLGFVRGQEQAHEEAAHLFGESLVLAQEVGNRSLVTACLTGFAALAAAMGRPEQAITLLGAVTTALQGFSGRLDKADQLEYNRIVIGLQSAVDSATWAASWAAGAALSVDEAIAFAGQVTAEP